MDFYGYELSLLFSDLQTPNLLTFISLVLRLLALRNPTVANSPVETNCPRWPTSSSSHSYLAMAYECIYHNTAPHSQDSKPAARPTKTAPGGNNLNFQTCVMLPEGDLSIFHSSSSSKHVRVCTSLSLTYISLQPGVSNLFVKNNDTTHHHHTSDFPSTRNESSLYELSPKPIPPRSKPKHHHGRKDESSGYH